MKEFNAETVRIETVSALAGVQEAGKPKRYAVHVGLDVHKETIAVAIARAGRDQPKYQGEIAHNRKTVEKLIRASDLFHFLLLPLRRSKGAEKCAIDPQ